MARLLPNAAQHHPRRPQKRPSIIHRKPREWQPAAEEDESTLSLSSSSDKSLRNNSYITELLQAFQDDSLRMQQKCCRAVTKLTSEDDSCKNALIQAGMNVFICRAMRQFPHDAKLQRYACEGLASLVMAANRQRIVEEGNAIELVLKAMQEFPTDLKVQDPAVRCLHTLSTPDATTKLHYCRAILDEGGVAVLSETLANFDELEALVHAVLKNVEQEMLNQLFYQGQTKHALELLIDMELSKPENLAIRTSPSFDNDKICNYILEAMQESQSDADLQVKCCRLIIDLTYKHAGNKARFIHAGAAELTVQAMQAYPQHAKLQFRACRAMRNLLCKSDDHKNRVVQAGGIEVLLQSLQTFPDDARLQEEACAALCLFMSPSTKGCHVPHILDLGGKHCMQQTLRNFPANERVSMYATKALSRLHPRQQQQHRRGSAFAGGPSSTMRPTVATTTTTAVHKGIQKFRHKASRRSSC